MRLTDALFCGVDTETGGLDPSEHDLLEVASVLSTGGVQLGRPFSTLVHPTKPIPPESSAIHHLVEADFRGAPDRAKASELILANVNPDAILYAHNAVFDLGFLPELRGRHWICTKRLAMKCWPDAPAWKNQVLRYWLDSPNDLCPNTEAHSALGDIAVTQQIFFHILMLWLGASHADDLSAFLEWELQPTLLLRMPFGKHKGEAFENIPADYLAWCVRSDATKNDADLAHTLRHHLGIPVA